MAPSYDEPNRYDVLGGLLSEAETRQQQEAEDRRIEAERQSRLNDHQARRQRLADAFDFVCRFPEEENEQGRKTSPDGFQRWAERFLALGAVLRECDAAIERLDLAERLRGVAATDAPAAMKFACALLLLASEGKAEPVASRLASAYRDRVLRQFMDWLPYILDNIWRPYFDENGRIPAIEPPDGITQEEYQKAQAAFGWRPFNPRAPLPAPPLLDTLQKIVSRCEDLRKQQTKWAKERARGVPFTAGTFAAFLRGELPDAYPLPTLEPLWNAAQTLNLGNVPPWRGEPLTGPEAFEALNALADWCRGLIAHSTRDRIPPPPPSDGPRVELRGRNQGPLVLGKEKDKLTIAQYDVVEALLNAKEAGLTKDELDRKSKHGDARKILKRLAVSDPDWKEVISFPGTTGKRYRIR